MAEYSLDVQGYFMEGMMDDIPSSQGLFIVYRGVLDDVRKLAILKELIFIGETDNLHSCMTSRENISHYKPSLHDGESLFFCYASTNGTTQERKDLANMLISVTLPILNPEESDVAVPESTVVKVEGDRHAFIPNRLDFS